MSIEGKSSGARLNQNDLISRVQVEEESFCLDRSTHPFPKGVLMPRYSNWIYPLLILSVMCGCFKKSSPEISGIYGSVEINSATAAPGTLISFINRENDSDSFSTVVSENGTYDYRPPSSIKIPPGEFIAVIRPQYSRTVEDENGMPQEEVIPGAPKSYGKYSDARKSDLVVRLESGKKEKFDISIRTTQK